MRAVSSWNQCRPNVSHELIERSEIGIVSPSPIQYLLVLLHEDGEVHLIEIHFLVGYRNLKNVG